MLLFSLQEQRHAEASPAYKNRVSIMCCHQSSAMGHAEVLAEVHYYNAEGECVGRMRDWATRYQPGCSRMYITPPEAIYFRVCCAYNYGVNCFDRATKSFCTEDHALSSLSDGDRQSAFLIEDREDFKDKCEHEDSSDCEHEDSSDSDSEHEDCSDSNSSDSGCKTNGTNGA